MRSRLRSGTLLCAFLCCTLHAQGVFPPPPVPAGNPITPAKALLGKALFWDEQLSSSRTVACGTCHVFRTGGADPRSLQSMHPGPDGVFGSSDDVHGSAGVVRRDPLGHFAASPLFGIRPQVTDRKAPSVVNAAYQVDLFWDGRASTVFRDPVGGAVLLPGDAALESQAASPPLSDVEMSHFGRSWTDVANDIQYLQPLALADQVPAALQAFVAGSDYAALFQQAFGSPGVSPARIVMALATYERTLVSDQSPFDRYLAGQGTLSPLVLQGLNVFRTLCVACHTDVDAAVLANGPVLNDYRNIGVRPVGDDDGRFSVTGNAVDLGRFKVPGLRNVALRAPLFHNGGQDSIDRVVDFYLRGGDFHQNQDPLLAGIPGHVTLVDRAGLIALLQTLTDPRVHNEQPPFDRPRLWSEGARVPVTFGLGTAGSGGQPPRAIAIEPPFAGNPRFTIGVDRTAPGVFHALALDAAANATPTVVLGQNVYLAATPYLALAGLGLTQGATPGGGWSSTTIAIPTALIGSPFYGQWIVVDSLGPNGFAVSDAFALQVF